MSEVKHISEEALERYAMQALPRLQIRPLEQHILNCPECRVRQQAANEYVAAMKWASTKIRERQAS